MNKEEMLIQAKQNEDENSWDEALAIYDNLLSEANNTNCELLERAAWCASRANKFPLAIEHFTK